MSWTLRVYQDALGTQFEDHEFEVQAELYAFLRVENPAPDTTPFNIDVEHGFAVFDNTAGHCIYSLDARIANGQLTKSDPIPEFFAPVEEFTEQ